MRVLTVGTDTLANSGSLASKKTSLLSGVSRNPSNVGGVDMVISEASTTEKLVSPSFQYVHGILMQSGVDGMNFFPEIVRNVAYIPVCQINSAVLRQ